MPHWIELQLYAEVAHALLRFDKRPAHVMVANQSNLDRNAALLREAHRRGHAGIRDRNDDVGVHGRFQCKLPAHGVARRLDSSSEDYAVRPRKVDVLEDTARLRLLRRVEARMHTFRPDKHQFARLDLTLV